MSLSETMYDFQSNNKYIQNSDITNQKKKSSHRILLIYNLVKPCCGCHICINTIIWKRRNILMSDSNKNP